MELRIGICGSAGTGKTSVAEGVSVGLGISLLKAREVTDAILKRDGYDYSSGIQVERFLANGGRQNEILRRTLEQQEAKQFVTDRTVVDLAAYAVCELHHSDTEALRRIVDTCRKSVGRYTHLFFCPWFDSPVSDNRRRTLNPWYQYMIHIMELGIMNEWSCSFQILKSSDNKEKVREVLATLKTL